MNYTSLEQLDPNRPTTITPDTSIDVPGHYLVWIRPHHEVATLHEYLESALEDGAQWALIDMRTGYVVRELVIELPTYGPCWRCGSETWERHGCMAMGVGTSTVQVCEVCIDAPWTDADDRHAIADGLLDARSTIPAPEPTEVSVPPVLMPAQRVSKLRMYMVPADAGQMVQRHYGYDLAGGAYRRDRAADGTCSWWWGELDWSRETHEMSNEPIRAPAVHEWIPCEPPIIDTTVWREE